LHKKENKADNHLSHF